MIDRHEGCKEENELNPTIHSIRSLEKQWVVNSKSENTSNLQGQAHMRHKYMNQHLVDHLQLRVDGWTGLLITKRSLDQASTVTVDLR